MRLTWAFSLLLALGAARASEPAPIRDANGKEVHFVFSEGLFCGNEEDVNDFLGTADWPALGTWLYAKWLDFSNECILLPRSGEVQAIVVQVTRVLRRDRIQDEEIVVFEYVVEGVQTRTRGFGRIRGPRPKGYGFMEAGTLDERLFLPL